MDTNHLPGGEHNETRVQGIPRQEITAVERAALLRKVRSMFGVQPEQVTTWTDEDNEPVRIIPNRADRRRTAREARRHR